MNETYKKYLPVDLQEMQELQSNNSLYLYIISKNEDEEKIVIAIQPPFYKITSENIDSLEFNIQRLRFTVTSDQGLTRVDVKPHPLLKQVLIDSGGQTEKVQYEGEVSFHTIEAFDKIAHCIITVLKYDQFPIEIINCCKDMFQCTQNHCDELIKRKFLIWGYVRQIENQPPVTLNTVPTDIKNLLLQFYFVTHQDNISQQVQYIPFQYENQDTSDDADDDFYEIVDIQSIADSDQEESATQKQSTSIFTPQRLLFAGAVILVAAFYFMKRKRTNQNQDAHLSQEEKKLSLSSN